MEAMWCTRGTWKKKKRAEQTGADGSNNRKSKSLWLDPCQEAAAKSIACLRRNDGDRTMCQDYFQFVSPLPSLGASSSRSPVRYRSAFSNTMENPPSKTAAVC